MRIAVCDDNKHHLLDMKDKLSALPMVEQAQLFSDLELLLSSIADGCFYDAVLMDIDWGQDRNGMDIAEEIYRLSPDTKIIYVTGYSDRFSQRIFLYRANLSGYLVKPIDLQMLEANLVKAAGSVPLDEQPALVVRRHGELVSIPFREIYSIESWKHTITIHSAQDTVISYERLDKIMESLPEEFYQCHKSYIVNMRQIQRFRSNEILLKNGKLIPVSRSKYNKAKEAYLSFIGGTI